MQTNIVFFEFFLFQHIIIYNLFYFFLIKGGNIRIRELHKKIKVIGSAYETTPGATEKAYDSQIVRLGISQKIKM